MHVLKRLIAFSFLTAVLASPATAQTAGGPQLATGTVVFGPQGNEVGKIEQISGDVVVLNTGSLTAALPKTAFGKGQKGPQIMLTKAQLEEAVTAAQQQAAAKLDAALVPGAALASSDGVPVGKIKSLDADGQVVVEGTDRSFSLKKDLFSASETGVSLRITAQQLHDAVNASAPAAQ